ncbi:conserved hypothetical protein [Desulfotalea psychrophila LSv54]|uniref:Radical SAM core domain-containing protein n=2 Tax=Desulfotalea psychrophila TaxID=84980 RepID=Q6AKM0_DESPS|nr:conserved hypothetical protein [Desulfotalea psychrophila LSv54]
MKSMEYGTEQGERVFAKIIARENLERSDLLTLLSLDTRADIAQLFRLAYEIKVDNVGKRVRLRGLVELSNVCAKDCYYCGIRHSNRSVQRYLMSDEQVFSAADEAIRLRFGSMVIQAGEQQSPAFTEWITRLIVGIKERSEGRLGITLSLGEQSLATYRRWFAAGAHRYLLRMESFTPALYSRLHPADHHYSRRFTALSDLRAAQFQVGSGVMINLPFQSLDNLVTDLLALRDLDVDMIGMGPYLPHAEAPLQGMAPDFIADPERSMDLGLKMIALARILLPNINIAATTALQALAPDGRERGLLAGANVIMPNITLPECKSNYQLYENKPGQDEICDESMLALVSGIDQIGESVGWDEWGDSPRYQARKNSNSS